MLERPSTFSRARSTRRTQAAQVMPPTSKLVVMPEGPGAGAAGVGVSMRIAPGL